MVKLTLHAIFAVGLLLGAINCSTSGGQGSSPAVGTVEYLSPGAFSDFSVRGCDVQNSTAAFTQEVTRTLVPVMGRRFPGDRLTLRFTNINQAGRRATQGVSTDRIVRNRTPSRPAFDYALRDKSGDWLARSSQRLVDNRPRTLSNNLSRSRPFINKGEMLQRWLQ